jgi:pimeloyl-ACP methyl ester carboxylesterase
MTTDTRVTRSEDGTRLAYETSGTGPTVVLVGAALSDRTDHRRLAKRLSARVRVVNYDRRGRGHSDPGGQGGVDRELDDLAAIIAANGGSATVFGSSSGAVLALRAAELPGSGIRRVVAYEPPLILDDSRPPVPGDATTHIHDLLSQGRAASAVRYFFGDVMGIPRAGVLAMRLMPGWSRSVKMAATLTNDLALLDGLQNGTPLRPGSWSKVTAPTLILTGSRSQRYFHTGAASLGAELPDALARVIDGLHHGSAVMGAEALAAAIAEFACADGAQTGHQS